MAQVVEINDPAELAGCRLLWTKLYGETAGASFFHSFDWFETYWRHHGDRQRLRLLLVESAGSPIGILPLAVRRETTRLGTIRVLTYPLEDWGSFYGPIGPYPTATLIAGLGHVRRTEVDWDLIDLRWIDSLEACDRTLRAMEIRGFSATTAVWAKSAQIETAGGWEAYWAARKRTWRKNVRYAEKRLAIHGPVEFTRFRPRGATWDEGEPCWPLYDECESLATRSWQGSSTTGTTLSHAAVQPFLRAAHAAAVHAGAADISLLSVGGVPAAFAYCYQSGGYVYGLRMGFDDEQAHEGAGTVLLARLIQDSFERGDRIVDLGSEYLECKQPWLTRLAESYHVTHFRASGPKAQALRLKRWLRGIGHRRGMQAT
ncbi:MAG TPA: GNAT family N-acetyltransferase [Pirellulales bacterium]|jgi:CelD/BcsL family acetyltransferase involved in cellulose biosynthesis